MEIMDYPPLYNPNGCIRDNKSFNILPTGHRETMVHKGPFDRFPVFKGRLPHTGAVYPAHKDLFWTIKDIFSTYFDPETEEIPSDETLELFIKKKWIGIAECHRRTVGFIVYEKELKGNEGFYPRRTFHRMHLRFWWVAPGYRNLGFGTTLLTHFFGDSYGTGSQDLKISPENTKLVNLFKRFGFNFQNTNDITA